VTADAAPDHGVDGVYPGWEGGTIVGRVYTHHGSPGGMQGVLYPPWYPGCTYPTMLPGVHIPTMGG